MMLMKALRKGQIVMILTRIMTGCLDKVTWIFASRLSQLHVNLKMVVVTRKKMILKMISTRKKMMMT